MAKEPGTMYNWADNRLTWLRLQTTLVDHCRLQDPAHRLLRLQDLLPALAGEGADDQDRQGHRLTTAPRHPSIPSASGQRLCWFPRQLQGFSQSRST